MRSPRETADLQLELYNARDLDGFCALFHDDARLLDLPSGTVMAEGIAAIRAFYAARFSNEMLSCRVHAHCDIGAFAIDRETIEGIPGAPVDVVALYEVHDGLITQVQFIRSS
ncbi:MAG: nuclear transport factor 2 family protein [Pseudomonadota bacterium]